MKNQVQRKSIRALALWLVVAVTFTVPGMAQETMQEAEVMKVVQKALPKWDRSMLKVQQQEQDWTSRVEFRNVFEAVQDKTPVLEKVPEGAERLGDKNSVVIVDRNRGRVRYVSSARGWNFKTDAKSRAVNPDRALELVVGAVRTLGISSEQFGKPRVDTQMAGGAPVGEKEIKDRFEMYRVVTISRLIGDIPVYGSRIRSAVSNRGQIQRLMVQWPAFRMPEKLAMKSREEVASQIVKKIMAQDPYGKVAVRANLTYAATTQDDEETLFVPSVVVSVMSEPTPYQLIIPLAGTAKR